VESGRLVSYQLWMLGPEKQQGSNDHLRPSLLSRSDILEAALYALGMGVLLFPINKAVGWPIWLSVNVVLFGVLVGLVVLGNYYRRRQWLRSQQPEREA
jgi:membrane protein YdbS with pleckstrin-like domain